MIPRLRVRKAANGDAAHAIGAFGVIVLPGDVVARARRQDIDVVTLREPFCRQAARVFRSAENLCSVSLNDESDPHDVIMCMLAFAVCVSHFPGILGSGPTPSSGAKSPESPATPIASSMSIRCPAIRGCCSRPSTPRSSRSAASASLAEIASGSDAGRRHSVQRKFQPLDRHSGAARNRAAPSWGVAAASSSRYTTRILRGCSGLPIGLACGRDRPSSRSSRRRISSQLARLAGFEARPLAAGRLPALAFFRTRIAAECGDACCPRASMALARHSRGAAAGKYR